MIRDMAFALWFFLPGSFANMAPVLAARLPALEHWNFPIDGGVRFRGRQLLGPHKTWRGIIAGVLLATLVLWLQQLLVRHASWAGWLADGVGYRTLPTLVLGPLFAIGALGGDALESFFKRRRGLHSGQAWFPFDQIDYIIGCILLTLPVVQVRPVVYLWALFLCSSANLAVEYLGYRLGIKERPI